MTKDNQKKNVAAEVARGEESRRAASVLLAAGLAADAVSRAYYAAFHYARAVLLSASEEPRTHGGVDRLLQRDFVRTGLFEADVAKLFTRLQRYRQDADYTAEYVFTAASAAEEIAAAETFIGEARRFLIAAHLLEATDG